MYILYIYLAACGLKGHDSGLPLPSQATALFYSPQHDQVSPVLVLGKVGMTEKVLPRALEVNLGDLFSLRL